MPLSSTQNSINFLLLYNKYNNGEKSKSMDMDESNNNKQQPIHKRI